MTVDYYTSTDVIPTYLGNPNIKARGVKMKLTDTEESELIRCAVDPVYFIETYVKIVHIDHGLVPMKLYPYQRKIVDDYLHNPKIIMSMSRQAGKTSVAFAILLHYIIFNSSKKVGLLANKESAAIEILDRVKMGYEHLPLWLQHGVIGWAKKRIELDNGCIIIAAATKGASIRGQSCAFLYIDEMAFVDNWEDFSASVLPTISSGRNSRLMMSSTPNGLNAFYSYTEKAKKGENGFALYEVPWHEVPGRDEAWKQEMLDNLDGDEQRFKVEYELEFMGSSGTLISGSKLKSLIPAVMNPLTNNDGLSVYEQPQKGHLYTLVADVARGTGNDYSAFHVIDITQTPFKQVAVYRDNTILPPDYAEVVNRIARIYNEAFVLVEINDIGGAVPDILFDTYEYENILCTESKGRAGKVVNFGSAKSDRGIRTTTTVKALGCSILKMLIENDQLIIVDAETVAEFTTFSKKGNSFEAEKGKHDDLVMGLVLFAWLSKQAFFKELNDSDIMAALKQRTDEQLEEMLMPFGFNSNDSDEWDDTPSGF